jgi:predicted outer membrane lipoprotein
MEMRYFIAWILGVPLGVIVLWYIVGHAACG